MYSLFFDDVDTPLWRPPSEADSFLLRVTRGCAHNKCTYCNMYRSVPFEVLSDDAINRQIKLAEHYAKQHVRRVFLADGDALVLSTARLQKILALLRNTFPRFERASSYAAPKDILRKSPQELRELNEAGLKLLYYGMESGDDETLAHVQKGVTGQESIEAGVRVREAGIKLSMMIILGLAGVEGSRRHAVKTAEAINAIQPTMLGAISLMLYRGSELKEEFERGEFHPLPPYGLMEELQEIISRLDLPAGCNCLFRSNHISNYIPLKATLPQEKDKLLADIEYSITELKKLKTWDVYNYS